MEQFTRRPMRLTVVVLAGVAIGMGMGAVFLPGGFDALVFYLHPPTPDTTAPAWVYLITAPLGWLGWPLGWQVLVMLSILAAGSACSVWPAARWWVVVASAPMIWNVWLGQIEVIPLAGLWLGVLVLRKELHPAWLGAAYLALVSKPQVGAGICVLLTWWVWREQGLKAISLALVVSASIILLTLVFWPAWLVDWLKVMSAFHATWWNASVWPYGLLAWPLAFLPVEMGQQQRLRMVASATLLGSPYFALYHCVMLLTLSDHWIALLLSWLPVMLGTLLIGQWMKLGWLLPASLLAMDLVKVVRVWLNRS